MDTLYSVNADGSRNFIHPADVSGRWQRRKHAMWALLMLVYVALPMIPVGGWPAVHIDIPGRQAFLFGQTFTNQDFYLVFFILSGIGFSLFVATSLFGRVWCGYACPQTVFLEGVYRWVERWIEGSRSARLRRNKGPWTPDKVRRKALKHGLFVVFSVAIAHVFLSYFIPWRELRHVLVSSPTEHLPAFLWTLAWTGILYFNYAWFREQTCLIICPYGRLQSALIDADTVIIGYDRGRGEPRSRVNDDGGDCVDCHRCVVVCPTGIDIRNGMQMECIGCANCIDACDEVMDKIHRPRGLVRYDSQRSFETGKRRSLIRPRAFVYALLALVGLGVALFAGSRRQPFEAKLLRARGMPYVLENDHFRNLYTLRIQNKEAQERVYRVSFTGSTTPSGEVPGVILPQDRVVLAGMADTRVPVFLTLRRDRYEAPFPVVFTVTDSVSGEVRVVEGRFLGP